MIRYNCKYVYLIGVGGIGMSALARYFMRKEKSVYGFDARSSEICSALEKEGVSIHYKDGVESIPEAICNANPDQLLVIYTPAVNYENEQITYFKSKNIEIYKRAQILGEISHDYFTISIAGTHGKTTTSCMLAHILINSGRKCTAFLGGISSNYNTNFITNNNNNNNNNILIIEADEYDYSFLNFNSDVAVITSIDVDHLDVYKNFDNIKDAFTRFINQIKDNGLLLFEKELLSQIKEVKNIKNLTYSTSSEADYYAKNFSVSGLNTLFDFYSAFNEKKDNCRISICMPGMHNISNALAAAAICRELGLNNKEIINGLKSFNGIKRRYEVQINREDLVFVDDYAHHPEEIKATINATKSLFPEREITVVFQPHLFSRTKTLANEFAQALSLASEVIILEVYPARELPIKGVSSKLLLNKCNALKKELCDKKQLLSLLEKKKIDILLTLGAGDISALVKPIKHMLN